MDTTRTDQKNDRKDTILERPSRLAAESNDAQARRGLIPAVIGLGVDVTEDAVTGAIGLVDDVRRETRQAVVASLDFADTLSKSVVGIGRRTVDRFDRLAIDVLTGAERVAVGTLAGLRSIAVNASALADQAARQVVGARNDTSVASA
jgi:hypothetical protein